MVRKHRNTRTCESVSFQFPVLRVGLCVYSSRTY